jgi:hypothetical protein
MPEHNQKNCEALAEYVLNSYSTKDAMRVLWEIISENYLENEDTFQEACKDYNWKPSK